MAIERTLVILKPDAIMRRLAHTIIRNYIDPLGLRVAALLIFDVRTRELERLVAAHYAKDDVWCLKWGTVKYDLVAPSWDAEFGGCLLSPIEFGYAIRSQLYDSVAMAPITVFVLEGECAVSRVREIRGSTDPSSAAKGTIRGDLCEVHSAVFGDFVIVSGAPDVDRESIAYAQKQNRAVRNLIHTSDSVEEAEREIKVWFPEFV